MFSIRKPTNERIGLILSHEAGQDFSYHLRGATREMRGAPGGYDCDHNRVRLGRGERDFIAACDALRRWEMFNLGWVEMFNTSAPIDPGVDVVVRTRCYGLWWLNVCRIVYLIDESGPARKYGFAYGTLPHHVERGEERFTIEWHEADDSVWYDIYAFSQPAYWMVRLGYPLARRLQRKFARDSKRAMLRSVAAAQAAERVAPV
jgi:uncharacterized protein (UPF0548 family)